MYHIDENYINTLVKVNNILKGWGGAFSFCNDKAYFRNIDREVMERIFSYHKEYKVLSYNLQQINKRQRVFGLQMLEDCTDKEPIYGPDGLLNQPE